VNEKLHIKCNAYNALCVLMVYKEYSYYIRVAQVHKKCILIFYWCTRDVQKVLQHLSHFSQNQHEMSAIFPVHNFECSVFYYSAAESTFPCTHGVVKMVWYCDMHFK